MEVYTIKNDNKVTIPDEYRSLLEDKIMLTCCHNDVIYITNKSKFDSFDSKGKTSLRDKIRLVFSNSYDVVIDKNNQFVLPYQVRKVFTSKEIVFELSSTNRLYIKNANLNKGHIK